MDIAFTGTRKLINNQNKIVWGRLEQLLELNSNWFVGEALGVDAVVRLAANRYNNPLTVFEVQGKQRYAFAQRSKRMIDAIAPSKNKKLIAFANKNCPKGCKPSKSPSGKGSGTWLTIAYAYHLNIDVEIIFLEDSLELPCWLQQSEPKQLSLW